jgi:hypothetical protein
VGQGMRLLDYLFEQPLVSVPLVEKRLACSFVTANKIVEQLAELSLSRETTGWQRNRSTATTLTWLFSTPWQCPDELKRTTHRQKRIETWAS